MSHVLTWRSKREAVTSKPKRHEDKKNGYNVQNIEQWQKDSK